MMTLTGNVQTRLHATLSQVTGHRACDVESDMLLESDLGIDSIKMIELSQTLLQLVPDDKRELFLQQVPTDLVMRAQTVAELEALLGAWGHDFAAPTPSTTASVTAVTAASAEPADLSQLLFALVARITGHRPGDLELDHFLESDLGIDSLKMIDFSQSLLEMIPEPSRAACLASVSIDRLMQAKTLREVQEILQPWNGVLSGTPAPAAAEVVLAAAPSEPVQIEVLDAQVPFLVGHWAVSSCTLCSRVRVQGPFDLELARRSWTALLARHPALRTYFEIPQDATHLKDYRLMLRESGIAPALELTDLRHLEPARQEQEVAARVEWSVNQQFALEQWPLHRFFALRLSEQVHEVFLVNHHLVSDGLSNQQLIREFLALYESLASGRPADLPPATCVEQYRATVAAINEWQDPAAERAAAEYLRTRGKQTSFWSPDGKPRATQRAVVRQHRLQLEPAATSALVELTAMLRLPMNTLVLGAFLRAVASIDGTREPSLIINVPTSGRVYPQVDAGGMVGCFAQNLSLDFRVPSAAAQWGSLLEGVHQEIEQAIAQGHDRALLRQGVQFFRDKLRLEEGRVPPGQCALIRAGMKSNLYLPYIGNTRIGHEYGPLRVLDYQAATAPTDGTIDTVLEIFHGRLEITANYDANVFSNASVAQLAQAFLAQLRSLSAYRPKAVAAAPAVLAPADPMLLSQVRQVAEEITHQPLTAADLALDLEADLGLDSLERIRIVSRLEQFVRGANRAALLTCRTLNEMLACLTQPSGSSGARSSGAGSSGEGGDNQAGDPSGVDQPVEDGDLPPIPYLRVVRQCQRTPSALAVLSREGGMSYAELDRQSNQLAAFLRARGVKRGSLVGLLLNRGPRFMVGWLAVLKAGGAYVPLDPDYPKARLSYIIEHARLETLLTEEQLHAAAAGLLTPGLPLQRVIYLDAAPAAITGGYPAQGRAQWSLSTDAALACVNEPDDPMVVLYTSGSTGKPKGVLLAHRGYENRLQWHQDLFQLRPGERVAQKTSICFDISVWELLWPLQYGGVVCAVETATLRDPQALARWVKDTAIHVMHFVPSLYGEFLSAIEQQPIDFPTLRHLIFSGEALPVAYVRRWMTRFGTQVGLTNLYGPTEASIDVTAEEIKSMPAPEAARVPIGKAMPNVHLRVLDDQMRPVPPGTLGELWIGGLQLAQGYLHDPQRTAETFRQNPFPEIPGTLLYRTGDLAVELPDGALDYRGRIDSQVKIRGFRVELGEIEAVLSTHPSVREVAVLAIDFGEGNLRLVAYLAGERCEPRALREFLGAKLPHYMIPHRFDWLPALPHNQNGKIDRNALKSAPGAAVAAARPAPAESNVVESPVVESPVLESPVLESTVVASPVMQSPVIQSPVIQSKPVGPAQQWLVRHFDPPHQWAGFSRFTYLEALDVEVFNRALNVLIEMHPALQSRFHQERGKWRTHCAGPALPMAAEYYEGSTLTGEELEAQLRELVTARLNALGLEAPAPLWSVLVVKRAERRFEICLLGHHMICDMLGNAILFKNLWRVYGELLAGAAPTTSSAATFVDYLSALEYERTPQVLAKHVQYWASRFGSAQSGFQLPFDHQHGENLQATSVMESFTLSSAESQELQRVRSQHGCAFYPLLLAPLYRMLGEWGGKPRVVLSHRTHGRDLGAGRTYFEAVGNFAINFPVAIQIGQQPWSSLIADIAEEIKQVPLNGASYDLAAEQLPMYPDDRLTPVRVNYLGNRDLPQSRLFEFHEDVDARYAAPNQKRTALIEVFFSMKRGQLHMQIDYSCNFHLRSTIRHWGQRYLSLVRELLSQGAPLPERTASSEIRVAVKPVAAAPVVAPLGSLAPASKFNGHPKLNGHSKVNGRTKPNEPATQPPTLKTGSGSLSGKVAIVTGAARGIGLAIARRLALDGARVALVSRSAASLEPALREIQAISPHSIAVTADVTRQDQVEAMVNTVLQRFGAIDILINNAGANRSALLVDSDPAEWRAIIDLNLNAHFLCCRYVVPHLLERGGGKIVNLSSAAGVIGFPLFSAYSAAKHGVLGLTKALAEEVKHRNIQVNAVCPALVDTRMTPQALRTTSIPPEQVADVVWFLSSPASAAITGESINIFGKQDMHAHGSETIAAVQAMTQEPRATVASCA
jgi:amino acid adenylation domain-containing protein